MQLSELRSLPKLAGSAELEFISNYIHPYRREGEVGLPLNPQAELYPLLKGRQFLYLNRENSQCYEAGLWFFGEDESPFLARLRPEVFRAYELGGERGFFDTLKPRAVHELEVVTGRPAKRQGDIFACLIPRGYLLRRIEAGIQEARDLTLFGTRHRINGLQAIVQLGPRSLMVGEGVITAPDHADLPLKGPHVISQGRGYLDPQWVD